MIDEIVYVCNRCGETFSLQEGHRVTIDGENWTVCPSCRSDDIEEGKRCMVCREIHREEDLRSGVCPDCFSDAISAWKACIGDLQPWVHEVLESEYGELFTIKE